MSHTTAHFPLVNKPISIFLGATLSVFLAAAPASAATLDIAAPNGIYPNIENELLINLDMEGEALTGMQLFGSFSGNLSSAPVLTITGDSQLQSLTEDVTTTGFGTMLVPLSVGQTLNYDAPITIARMVVMPTNTGTFSLTLDPEQSIVPAADGTTNALKNADTTFSFEVTEKIAATDEIVMEPESEITDATSVAQPGMSSVWGLIAVVILVTAGIAGVTLYRKKKHTAELQQARDMMNNMSAQELMTASDLSSQPKQPQV